MIGGGFASTCVSEEEQIARLLGIAVTARRIYGSKHERTTTAARRFRNTLQCHLADTGRPFEIAFTPREEEPISIEGVQVEARGPLAQLATCFEQRECGGLTFKPGADERAVQELLTWLTQRGGAEVPHLHGVHVLDLDAVENALTEARPEGQPPVRIPRNAAESLDIAMEDARNGRTLDMTGLNDLTARVAEEVFTSGTRILGPVLLMDDIVVETNHHSVNVFLIATTLLQPFTQSPDELATLAMAALLHDIGKSRIPNTILGKEGPLTAEETGVMRRHTEFGAEILMEQPGLHPVAVEVAYCHHMRDHGEGYPKVSGRLQPGPVTELVQVADMFEALTARRSYREPMPVAKAIEIIESTPGMGSKAAAVQLLQARLSEAPAGAHVRLATGERAVVISSGKDDQVEPVVRIFTDAAGEKMNPPLVVDLAGDPERQITDIVVRPGQTFPT